MFVSNYFLLFYKELTCAVKCQSDSFTAYEPEIWRRIQSYVGTRETLERYIYLLGDKWLKNSFKKLLRRSHHCRFRENAKDALLTEWVIPCLLWDVEWWSECLQHGPAFWGTLTCVRKIVCSTPARFFWCIIGQAFYHFHLLCCVQTCVRVLSKTEQMLQSCSVVLTTLKRVWTQVALWAIVKGVYAIEREKFVAVQIITCFH